MPISKSPLPTTGPRLRLNGYARINIVHAIEGVGRVGVRFIEA